MNDDDNRNGNALHGCVNSLLIDLILWLIIVIAIVYIARHV